LYWHNGEVIPNVYGKRQERMLCMKVQDIEFYLQSIEAHIESIIDRR